MGEVYQSAAFVVAYLFIFGFLAVAASKAAERDGANADSAHDIGASMILWPITLPIILGLIVAWRIFDHKRKEPR